MTFEISRRNALVAGLVLPGLAALGSSRANASAEMMGTGTPLYYRFKLGNFEVTTLSGGSAIMENPQETFGLNASAEEFTAASEAAFIPSDVSRNSYSPVVVNTGSELVLFDTGPNAASLLNALEAAGYSADQIDVVIITHMHGDHINGLMNDGSVTYPNARYISGVVENEHWSNASNEGYEKAIRPLLNSFTFIDDGEEVLPGITAEAAYGHTPGHFIYHLESAGQKLTLTADTANHYVWSVGFPGWDVRFDMDKPTANETRRRVLAQLASNRTPFIGYHLPFPALGFVEETGEGFRFVPASYQFLLSE